MTNKKYFVFLYKNVKLINMLYEVYKEIEWDMGHRVYTQKLNQELALTTYCKCRQLHGHRYKARIYIASQRLRDDGMVMDFNHYNYLKKLIDDFLDHKFMLSIEDPLFDMFLQDISNSIDIANIDNLTLAIISPDIDDIVVYKMKNGKEQTKQWILDLDKIKKQGIFACVLQTPVNNIQTEFIKSFVFVNFVPTAEEISVFIGRLMQKILDKNNLADLKVTKVELFETPKSVAVIHF